MIDGITGDAFSATTLPPIPIEDASVGEKVIQVSRERYAVSREEIEEKIRRWTGVLNDEEKQVALSSYKTPPSAPVKPAHATPLPPKRTEVKDMPPKTPRPSQVAPRPVEEKHPTKEAPAYRTPRPEAKKPPLPQAPEPVAIAPSEIPKPIVLPEPPKAVVAPQPTQEEAGEESPPTVTEEKPERILYPANCATCGLAIEVPFQPDSSRPTFCKDCLRDYQRAVAKAKNESLGRPSTVPLAKSEASRESTKRSTQPKIYAPEGAPMRLSQAQYIEPKKFKSLKKKPDLKIDEIRALIDNARQGQKEEE
ncbi:MAG: CxxC-x17-CxxC domain-containing protein, partial [Candidatus Moraniibacteriota bacterium]